MERGKIIVLFIPVKKGMMEKMESFYGDILGFRMEEGELFINNISTVRGQLQYSRVKIDPQKNPLFQFNVVGEFPEYCRLLRNQGVEFEFVAMTPGGYMAKILDPCDNSILIECDSFENSSDFDLTSWEEYRRY
ncbi:hypothetical protein RCH14_003620 [Massilia sp. MP_M2]|uniref:hypothetical protein n=1 Tax=Massilia sp. MP_M2 TaxID=3071713 RepID=UPI00319DFE6A